MQQLFSFHDFFFLVGRGVVIIPAEQLELKQLVSRGDRVDVHLADGSSVVVQVRAVENQGLLVEHHGGILLSDESSLFYLFKK